MKRKIVLFALLLFTTSFYNHAACVQIDNILYLNESNLADLATVCSTGGYWKFHPGDDTVWANQDFDDSNWQIGNTIVRTADKDQVNLYKKGWYRLHLDVDSSLWNKEIGLTYSLMGAIEIYVNGKLVLSKGKVGNSAENEEFIYSMFSEPDRIALESKKEQLIAVRFSAYNYDVSMNPKVVFGFILKAGFYEKVFADYFQYYESVLKHQMFFTGLSFSFVLIHLLLFIFYPSFKTNLYFALFTISVGIICYAPTQIEIESEINKILRLMFLFKLSLISVSVCALKVLYSIYYKKNPFYFKYLAGAGLLAIVFHSYLNINIIYIIVIFYLLEVLRVIIKSIYDKKEMSWVIGIGFLIFLSFSAYQMLIELIELPLWGINIQPYLLGVLGLVVSISLFLAHRITTTNINLEKKLAEVQELSDKTLEQERKAREQEKYQILLETNLEHQKIELEKAHELEKAYHELEKANEQIRDTQAQLVQSEKMASLGQLVAGVAHEINNPMGAVKSIHKTLMSAIEKLKTKLDENNNKGIQDHEQINKFLSVIDDANEVISKGTDRVSEIVRRLKSFARLDEAELQKVDINECIEDTLTLMHHEIKYDINIHKRCEKVPEIACYPGQLNQVLLNLLINAKHALEGKTEKGEKGEIQISTSYIDEKVLITIEDNGCGIPQKHLNKIFDPGFTTKGVGVGTGLGLSICYQIIKEHRGEIKVTSKEGYGTIFLIELPSNLEEILDKESKNKSK